MIRRLALVLGLTAVVLLATGTGAFSSVSAERGVDVAVVDDEHAYVAIQNDETVGLSGSDQYTHTYLTVRNRFPVPGEATVNVDTSSSNGLSVDLSSAAGGTWRGYLESEENKQFTAAITCTQVDPVHRDSSATLTYEIVFDGDGVYSDISPRTVNFDVECPIIYLNIVDTSGTVNSSFTVLDLHREPSTAPSVSVDDVSASSDSISVSSQQDTVTAECEKATAEETTTIDVEGSVGTAAFDRDVTVSITCKEDN